MADRIRVVTAPPAGIWRVGRQPDPLHLSSDLDPMDLKDARSGSRFDSYYGNYGVLYFATHLETCFEETLSRIVPRPKLADLVRDDWAAMHVMSPGNVAREWRLDRREVRVGVEDPQEFVDVDHADTLAVLERALRPHLNMMPDPIEELDTSVIRSAARGVTRLISQFVYAIEDADGYARFAGIRYASRVDSKECWAVFDRTKLRQEEIRVIYQNDKALQKVARRRELTIH